MNHIYEWSEQFNKFMYGKPYFVYIRTEPITLQEQFEIWLRTRFKQIYKPFGHYPKHDKYTLDLTFVDKVHTLTGDITVLLQVENAANGFLIDSKSQVAVDAIGDQVRAYVDQIMVYS